MRFRSMSRCLTIMLLLAAAAHAGSAVILYQVNSLGGGIFQYNYSVFNNNALGAGVPIQLFDILFDPTQYLQSSLKIDTQPPLNTQWSEQFLTSVPPIPVAYDVFALGGGIPDGATVSGFSVEFLWLGQGTPGDQSFQIYDPQSFDLLASGTTSSAVPEPSAFFVVGIALVSAAWIRRRSRITRLRRALFEGSCPRT